jgi:pimeloyl-ACP methyl ester carboxylesterase
VRAPDGDVVVGRRAAARRLRQLTFVDVRPLVAITPIGAEGFSASLPAALGDRFAAVHVFELPRTGRTVESIVTAVREELRAHGSGAVLFGHSMNGTLALAAASGLEDGCAGVIAVGAPPALPSSAAVSERYWAEHAEPGRKARAADLIAAHEATDDDGERSRLRERYDRLRRWYDVDFDPTALDALARIDFAWVQSVFDSGSAVDWRGVRSAVRCPVLLALGEYDFIVPPTSWVEEPVPAHWTVERFGRSGHTPFFEQPAEFLAAVDRWLLGVA